MKVEEQKVDYISLKRDQSPFTKVKIASSKTAHDFINKFYLDDKSIYESFFILCLNRANMTDSYTKISQGGTAGTVVDRKIIAKYALDALSHGVILAHNHPYGNIKPSESDKDITTKIKEGLELLDIKLLDHIILSGVNDEFYSFADYGII